MLLVEGIAKLIDGLSINDVDVDGDGDGDGAEKSAVERVDLVKRRGIEGEKEWEEGRNKRMGGIEGGEE